MYKRISVDVQNKPQVNSSDYNKRLFMKTPHGDLFPLRLM